MTLSATVDIRFFTISAFWNEFYVKLSIDNFGTWQKQQNVAALSQSHPSHLCPSQNQNIRLSEAEARYSKTDQAAHTTLILFCNSRRMFWVWPGHKWIYGVILTPGYDF